MTFNVVVHSILLLAHLTATLVGAHKVPLLISNIFDCHFKKLLDSQKPTACDFNF